MLRPRSFHSRQVLFFHLFWIGREGVRRAAMRRNVACKDKCLPPGNVSALVRSMSTVS